MTQSGSGENRRGGCYVANTEAARYTLDTENCKINAAKITSQDKISASEKFVTLCIKNWLWN